MARGIDLCFLYYTPSTPLTSSTYRLLFSLVIRLLRHQLEYFSG